MILALQNMASIKLVPLRCVAVLGFEGYPTLEQHVGPSMFDPVGLPDVWKEYYLNVDISPSLSKTNLPVQVRKNLAGSFIDVKLGMSFKEGITPTGLVSIGYGTYRVRPEALFRTETVVRVRL